MKKFSFTTIGLAAALSVSSLLSAGTASASDDKPGPRAAATEHAPPAKGPQSADKAAVSMPVKDEYIVTMKPGKDPAGLARGVGASPRFTYRSALTGFAAHLNEGQLNALRHHPDVVEIEQDQEGGVGATQSMEWTTGHPWGLDRIDQRNRPLSGTYTYNGTASNVRAYVIDSGLQPTHPQFGSRAISMYSALGGSADDCNGHGTHVAGTIGGSTYGVAKNVLLRGVRVLDCNGGGSTSLAIAGVDWVRVNAIHPAVANISLQFGKSNALNTAVYNLAQSGVFVAAAAGNWNVDACTISPASAYGAYTTGATTSGDARSIWTNGQASNWGTCVDGNAPGTSIKSAYLNGSTDIKSGTSMASPHVAGVAALYKATSPNASWITIRDWINNASTKGLITGLSGGTPNRLLYKAAL